MIVMTLDTLDINFYLQVPIKCPSIALYWDREYMELNIQIFVLLRWY